MIKGLVVLLKSGFKLIMVWFKVQLQDVSFEIRLAFILCNLVFIQL